MLTVSWDFPSLHVSNTAYDSSSILIGFNTADELAIQETALLSDVLDGTQVSSAFTHLPNLLQVELAPGVSVADAVAAYSALPFVAFAEPNYDIQLNDVPSDLQFQDLWGMNNTGQTGGTVDADIDALEAWEVTTGSGNTIVAVIDTGVDYTHPDLAGNIWTNTAEAGGLPNVDDDGNGFVDDIHGYDFFNDDGDPMDDHDHGTHVAGTIGAVGDNALGVTGVNWNVQIMALKFLNANGSGSVAAAVGAINYAVANGATISSNSWGDYNGSIALRNAIEAAVEQDHIFVAAAGNGNFAGVAVDNDRSPFFPASYDSENIISVAATDHNDQIASFSNYGATSVDVSAPGVGVLSTTINNTYGTYSGTSMATPHVAGLVALIRDLHPDWSAQEVIHHVLGTVDPLADLQGITTTGGRINAATALGNPATPGPEIAVFVGNTPLYDGAGVVDFGDTPPGVTATNSFTVRNVGTEPLLLNGPISLPAGYQLESDFGSTTLQPGESTQFAIGLSGTELAPYGGTVSFGSNDADESSFEFTVTGSIANVPLIIDNGDSGYSTVGEWTRWTNQGYGRDVDESFPGNGSDVATWSFTGISPGEYRISATWTAVFNRATNAPFEVYDGDTLLTTQQIDQQVAPQQFNDEGVGWHDLIDAVTLTSGTLTVRLTDNADGRLNADAMRLQRIGDAPEGAEIEVRADSQVLVDGVASVELGEVPLGTTATQSFVIRNVGTSSLTLSEPISIPQGFDLASSFDDALLAPGESTTFAVSFTAQTEGLFSGAVQFGNSDLDEGPFDFSISATAVDQAILIDNDDAGFSTVGEWTRWTGQGMHGAVHESLPGTGADVASWTFSGLLPGMYEVAATWTADFNRATDSPFTVLNGTTPVAQKIVDQKVGPNDFFDQGVHWEDFGIVTLTSDTLVVQLADNANGRLNADAIRVYRIGDLPEGAEIDVSLAGQSITNGSAVDFGATPPGTPVTRTFDVVNAGSENLVLSTPISVPNGFSVAATFGASTIAPGETTSFTIQLDSSEIGTYGGVVSFATNDSDESPFEISVSGTVDLVPIIIDNGADGFTTIGEWTNWTGQGYQGDVDESFPGSGADVATWTFANLLPGEYHVSATWTPEFNRASDAGFTISDSGAPLSTTVMNQRFGPNDFFESGVYWETLNSSVLLTGDRLEVSLNDNANGRLNADAIRVLRVGDLPSGAEIEVQLAGATVADGSTVDFGETLPETPVMRTFEVRNSGADPLTLAGPISVPAGFSVVSTFGDQTLAAGESTTFAIQLDATAIGNYQGEVSFGTNDSDENPFSFTVSGVVDFIPLIVDNGDVNFTTVGEWTNWTGQGYQGDVDESLPGTGADVATWTFPNLAAGEYQISATWTPEFNRASNSPFSIYEDATLLGSFQVNQRIGPNQFVDAGAYWNDLGSAFTLTGGDLHIRLSDDANGRLNADAIRVARIEPQIQTVGFTQTSSAATAEATTDVYFLAPIPELVSAIHGEVATVVLPSNRSADLSLLWDRFFEESDSEDLEDFPAQRESRSDELDEAFASLFGLDEDLFL